ncbi:MAG TPA: hypothetical protein VFB45_18450 [Pseudolabrys sp.]|nr:hypothetical protein [Pseudolabrys sp.]
MSSFSTVNGSCSGEPSVVAFPSLWDALRLDAVASYADLLDASASELRSLDPKRRLRAPMRHNGARRPLGRARSRLNIRVRQ